MDSLLLKLQRSHGVGAEPLDHKGEDPEGARLRDEGEGFALRPFVLTSSAYF